VSNYRERFPVRRPSLCLGLVSAILGFLVTSTASAQLEGRFYLDKEQYLSGEPIYLHFDLTNNGAEPMQFATGNSYSFCSGYRIEVSNDPYAETSSCAALGSGGSCIGGGQIIEPGQTLQDKVLLNYEHDLSRAGTYDIRASRTLDYRRSEAGLAGPIRGVQMKSEAVFHIRVEDGSSDSLPPIFQPYVADLHSNDEERQREAARVIGSLAPPFLEDTIHTMMDSPVTRPFALIGLRHLNTARSRQALAGVVQGTSGYSYEKERAIKYLSEMEDKKYFPLLLDEAKKSEPNQARDYVLAAAQLGGEDAMPYVISLLTSPNSFSRFNGIMGLPQTGSRRAVPILLELLRSPDVDVGQFASIGLIQLTHRSPLERGRWFSDSPSNEYPNWTVWWMLQGDTAPIYGPGQCGSIVPFK
jgi:HEAT repeats